MRFDAGQTPELPQGHSEVQNISPPPTVEFVSYVIREAQEGDAEFLRTWLPQTLVGTPAAQLLVAIERDGGAIVGAAAVRVFQDCGARFTVFVLPEFRRRGCGRSLLASVRNLAKQQGVARMLSEWSNQVGAIDEPSLTATAFFLGCGLTVEQDVVSYRAELIAALRILEPLYERRPLPVGTRIAPIDQVDARQLAMFAVNHVGGLPEDVSAQLIGNHNLAYSRTTSLAAIANDQIVGSILTRRMADSLVFVSRIVAGEHRGSGINLALMCLAARQAASEGVRFIEFESDIRGNDTVKLASRFAAEEIGRRQCWGETLDTTAPAIVPDRITSEPIAASVQLTLTSQHTSSFAELLEQLGISIAVTTYQAGKLVLLRAEHGAINTHFRSFSKPMGLAVDGNRLAIGTAVEIWEYHNAPAVAKRVESPTSGSPSLDSCFLPRSSHTTGDIQIHEMAWVDDELWFINTRFSCLCTRDVRYSFVPHWRPPFISAIAPEDRCHLNGFCRLGLRPDAFGMRVGTESQPTFFVTALGETDTRGGWRANKRSGGLLMETGNNEILLRGLSMPHSPRLFNNQLWLCESGTGTFGRVDLQVGRYEPIASLPGFTRGVDFFDRYAFIGLSQVRESAVFSGIPIAERPLSERACGVWVIDMVTGETVAWLKFDDGVQEIFAVTVLPNSRFPDVINDQPKLIADSFILPDESLSSVPDNLRFVESKR